MVTTNNYQHISEI